LLIAQRGYLASDLCTWPSEQDKQNRVEESNRVVDDELVNDGRNDEGEQLGNVSPCLEGGEKSVEIQVDVKVKPIVDYNIPLAIIRPELARVPPVRVEGPIWEPGNFGPEVEPAMQKSKEAHNKEEH
jgi:hypothetical protein